MVNSQIEVLCPACGKEFQVSRDQRGKVVDCPRCGCWIDVAEPDQSPTIPPVIEEGFTIELEELILRRVKYGDWQDLFEIYANPEVTRYQTFPPWTSEQTEQFVCAQYETSAGDPGMPFVLVAVHRADQKVIADCQITIRSCESRQGEIGFSINPAYSGRGLATKMINAGLGFGFHRLGLHRIEAGVFVRNDRSWRLMERVGMRREGHLIHSDLIDGEWVDDYVYAMLDEEWRARNAD